MANFRAREGQGTYTRPKFQKTLSSIGYAVTGVSQGEFMTVRLYDEPPHANLDPLAMEAKEKGRTKD